MPDILSLLGLHLVSETSPEKEVPNLSDRLEYHLEMLAEYEHQGWMKWHFLPASLSGKA